MAQPRAQARSARLEGPVETVKELAAEHPGQDAHRYQESGSARDPPVPRHGEATARHDAVEVRVEAERLRPSVEDGDGAGHGTQPAPADVMERLEGGPEQHRIAASSIGQEERMQCARHREDEVEVLHGEQIARLGLYPPSFVAPIQAFTSDTA